MKKQTAAAIATALTCLPTEISNLIGQYAIACPHRFSADGFTTGSCESNDQTKTTELKIAERTERWRIFVSEIPLSAGETEWTVDFPERKPYGLDRIENPPAGSGWIGVGVTATAGNRSSLPDRQFGLMAGKNDWLIAVLSNDGWHGIHNEQFVAIPTVDGPIRSGSRRVCFAADALTGTVSARLSPAESESDNISTTAMFGNTAEPFAKLRPCIVIAGSASAVFRSGPPIASAVDGDPNQTAIVVQAGVCDA